MKQQKIDITFDFPQPVEKIFAWFSDHNNLSLVFFPYKVKRIVDGHHQVNGVGSVRSLQVWPSPALEETVTAFEPNQRIEYKITAGVAPITDHYGTMLFSAYNGGTRFQHTIVFRGVVPVIGSVVRFTLEQTIRHGLEQLARKPL